MPGIIAPTEAQECRAFLDELIYVNLEAWKCISHVSNEGKRGYKAQRHFKMQGGKTGVFDLDMCYPVAPYCGLKIEMKRTVNSKIDEDQEEWFKRYIQHGYAAFYAWGNMEAMRLTKLYLNGQLTLDDMYESKIKPKYRSSIK